MMHDKYVDVTTGTIPLSAPTRVVRPKSEGPWMFTLNYARPPRGLHANDSGVHWATRAGAIKDIRMEVMARTRALRIGELDSCTIDLEWVVKTKRPRDPSNLWPFAKAIYDGIGSNKGVSARIVPDDDQNHMSTPTPTIRYERGCTPHFEVKITAGRPDERKSA